MLAPCESCPCPIAAVYRGRAECTRCAIHRAQRLREEAGELIGRMPMIEIARRLGCSWETVRYAANKPARRAS